MSSQELARRCRSRGVVGDPVRFVDLVLFWERLQEDACVLGMQWHEWEQAERQDGAHVHGM